MARPKGTIDERTQFILTLLSGGWRNIDIVRAFKVSKQTVCNIKRLYLSRPITDGIEETVGTPS